MSDFFVASERGDSYNGNRIIMWNIKDMHLFEWAI
jgi:hypothetical protein